MNFKDDQKAIIQEEFLLDAKSTVSLDAIGYRR